MPIVNIRKLVGDNSEENPEPIITSPRSNGVDIYNENGEKVGNVPYGQNGITGSGETVYQGKNDKDETIWTTNVYDLKPSITLNENTGKISINAPKSFLESDIYTKYFDDDKIRGLSNLYVQNKDAKVEMADGSEKTVKELIESWNEDFPQLVKMQQDYNRMGNIVTKNLGEEAASQYNLGTYQLMGTSAYSGKDDDYLVLPETILNNPKWSFFNNLEGLDAETHKITKKNFEDGYYHIDVFRDLPSESLTSISALKNDVAKALANYDGKDVNEYARLIAFNNFLNGEAQEGASNDPNGTFLDRATMSIVAFNEAFYRNTAEWFNNFANDNFVTRIALAPFSAVDWIAGKTDGYQRKYITDELANATSAVVGYDITPDAETVAEFLQNEETRRGNIYALTDSTASLIYNITGFVTYAAESVIGSIAQTRFLMNAATLGISGASASKNIKKMTDAANSLAEKAKITYPNTNVIVSTTGETLAMKGNEAMLAAGVPKSVANLMTGAGDYSIWQKLDMIGSINPAQFVQGAYVWNQYVKEVGHNLKWAAETLRNADVKYQEGKRYADWVNSGGLESLLQRSDWKAYFEGRQQALNAIEKAWDIAEKYRPIYESGEALLKTATAITTTLSNYAKYMPAVYYVGQVIIGTAMTEADSFRRLFNSTDSQEQRDILWGMVAKSALGWTVGLVLGKIVNGVFSGAYDEAIEWKNTKATENIAKAVVWVRGRTTQAQELIHGGKDLADVVKSPTKKAAIKFNQALSKSQEYIATAGDAVRDAGGTEVAARAATIAAVDQMKANQNTIDLYQHPEWLLANLHSDAYPAFNYADKAFEGVDHEFGLLLAKYGLDSGNPTTAVIGGVSSNAGIPQDLVNYRARALQRAMMLRNDNDLSKTLITLNYTNFEALETNYVLTDPRAIKEREIAKKVMADIEAKYPKELTDLIKNKWVPLGLQDAYQFNEAINEGGYYLKSLREGWKKSGLFGANNELWFPLQRVTDAQKDFAEAARNPMSIIKRGAIKRRFYDPMHYSPGSDEMTDFVDPMVTLKMYQYQRAVEYTVNNFVHVNLMNPLVKNIVKLDGSQVDAALTYERLQPSYEPAVKVAMNSAKQSLAKSGIVADMMDKQRMETKIKNAQKAVDDAKEKWDNIPNIEVKASGADKSKVIDTLPEDKVDDYLDKMGVPFDGEKIDTRKWLNHQVPGFDVLEWGAIGRDHTNELFPGGLYRDPESHGEVRIYVTDIDDAIKLSGVDDGNIAMGNPEEVTKHFNIQGAYGLIPLYFDSIGDKFTIRLRWYGFGSDLSNWKAFLHQLKSDGVKQVPLAIFAYKNDPMDIIRKENMDVRGFGNIINEINRAVAAGTPPNFSVRDISAALYGRNVNSDWLRKKIRESVPSKKGPGTYLTEKELDDLIKEGENYDWNNDSEMLAKTGGIASKVEKELQHLPMDITEEVKQAFIEKGTIPIFHNQRGALGSFEFNNDVGVPAGEERYTAGGGVGDALWLAPNASYTDAYGDNKLAANLPIKNFMPAKEMEEIAKDLGAKLASIEEKILENERKIIEVDDKKLINGIHRKAQRLSSWKDLVDLPITLPGEDGGAPIRLNDFGRPSDHKYYTEKHGEGVYVKDQSGLIYKISLAHETVNGVKKSYYLAEPIDEVYHSMNELDEFREEAIEKLSKKDRELYKKIEPVVQSRGKIKSYRALAEYSGKPVIDTTIDMYNDRGINGTAFFYYKGVDPKFDEEIGKQLETQRMGDSSWSQEGKDEAFDDWAQNTTLGDFADYIANNLDLAEAFGDGAKDLKEVLSGEMAIPKNYKDILLKKGAMSDANIKYFSEHDMKALYIREKIREMDRKAIGLLEHEDEGMARLIDYIGDAVRMSGLSSNLADGKSILDTPILDILTHRAVYSEEIGPMLDSLGIENPEYVSPEEKAAWDAIDPRQDYQTYTDQDLADMRLRDLERKRKILKKELKKRCD